MDNRKNLSDEKIIERVLGGDKESYGEIIKRYEKKLERYINTFTKNEDDAQDVLQDVFLKSYENLRKFDQKMKFSSWIYRIAHNESINLVKSGFWRKVVSLGDWLMLGRYDGIEEKIDREMLRKKLKECIDKLDVKYREPLVLYLYEEKNYEEISDILRLPVSHIGVLIHRAKNKIWEYCHEK